LLPSGGQVGTGSALASKEAATIFMPQVPLLPSGGQVGTGSALASMEAATSFMPQVPLLPSGGQVGTGSALAFMEVAIVEADAVWVEVEAAAPERTKATTKARTRFFMGSTPFCSWRRMGEEWKVF
jgi:hypothetical protein